ncbi:hypothetical protein [Curtobacterium pusillum]|uniref:Septum formation-related domain-containing protein n=1 Tax=Curtobacterium pusillum TaxID=69373 RepID=A0ABX2MAY0_9MICO|nr:hypothetical protein [Curtobacterium pusillum]NUU15194.1 hypothetical protein [Curtobacterium pusillum]
MRQAFIRTIVGTTAACAVLGLATGCATEGASSARTSTLQPSPPPVATRTATAQTPSAAAPSASPPGSSTATHWLDVCSAGAAETGISELESTSSPVQDTSSGSFTLTYPVARFADGHTDPYAAFVCVLSDDSGAARFVSGGPIDTH